VITQPSVVRSRRQRRENHQRTGEFKPRWVNVLIKCKGLAAALSARLPKRTRATIAKDLVRLNAAFGTAHMDLDALYRHDEEFHRRYVVAAGGLRLVAMHDSIKPQAERYIRMYIGLLSSDVSSSVREHEAVIDAIATGKPAAAERAVRENWRHATDRIARVIDLAGELGQG